VCAITPTFPTANNVLTGFSASHLFYALYANLCSNALKKVVVEKGWVSAPSWNHCARIICQTMAEHFSANSVKTVEIQKVWRAMPPFPACILCPFRKTHVRLQCGHAICENCVWHWSRRANHTTLCRFDECPACGSTTALTIRLRPPTSGFRTLSLDGGGVRGLVTLEILRHIMTCFNVSLEAYQMFDFIVGTSTGKYRCAGLRALPQMTSNFRFYNRLHTWPQAVASLEVYRGVPYRCLRCLPQAATVASTQTSH
jgi:hypothetical protein